MKSGQPKLGSVYLSSFLERNAAYVCCLGSETRPPWSMATPFLWNHTQGVYKSSCRETLATCPLPAHACHMHATCPMQCCRTHNCCCCQPLPPRLKFVKFQNVTMLSIFIESNQGGEETTKVQKIALLGQTGDMDKFNVAGKSAILQSECGAAVRGMSVILYYASCACAPSHSGVTLMWVYRPSVVHARCRWPSHACMTLRGCPHLVAAHTFVDAARD